MAENRTIAPYDWFAHQFTVESRKGFVEQINPLLRPLLKPGDNVLDLCCGAGPITFFLAEQGAKEVTGIDLVPSLIAMARQEAIERASQAKFVQADVLTYPFGNNIYDLIVCFGNAILDFPHRSFPRFRDRVFQALKAGGRFVIEYFDGLLRVKHMSEPEEVIEQGLSSQILRRFIEYDPLLSAYKMEYRNLSSKETYVYTGYIYTRPLVQIILEARFELERSIPLSQWSFMETYVKP